MPGLTLWRPPSGSGSARQRLLDALRLSTAGGDAEVALAIDTATLLVGHAAYAGYPIRSWIEGQHQFLLEGHLYGLSGVECRRRLGAVARASLEAPDPGPAIAEFVRSVDGEYVVIVAAGNGRTLVFSDALGRLPLYVHDGPEGVVVAREAKWIAAIARQWAFDPLGVGQTLWLGYPLGDRTLFRDIARAVPGFLMDLRPDQPAAVPARSTYEYRCDADGPSVRPDALADEVAARLTAAAAERAGVAREAPAILSLSGGNDSRTVLGALEPSRANVVSASFSRSRGRGAADVTIAERLARAFQIPWERMDIPDPVLADEQRLVWLRDGLNHVGMAFILAFLDRLRDQWGERAVLLTGDGGDKVLPDLRPTSRVRSSMDVANVLARDGALASATDVEAALGLRSGTLIADLGARLDRYPEAGFADRAVRFQIAERGRKWLFEGEERGRSILWQTTPFYALPVFEAAMAVPHRIKRDLGFYARVQRALDPRLLAIPHADFGLAIDSRAYRARAAARRLVLRHAGSLVRSAQRSSRGRNPLDAAASDALIRLEGLHAAGSPLGSIVDTSTAATAIRRASTAGVESWRTILLLDTVWTSHLGF